jgi:hypothetical protein
MKFSALALVAAATVTFAGVPAQAAVILTGLSAGTCEGSCFNHGTLTRTLSASQFTGGQMNINALLFNRGQLGAQSNSTFKITFWVNGGTDKVGDFGSFNVAGLVGDTFTLSSLNDFVYDPEAMGDLTIRIDLQNFGGGGGFGGGFNVFNDDSTDFTGPVVQTDLPDGGGDQGFTGGFQSAATQSIVLASPTPEPGAWALMIGGFMGAGAMLRRRRTAQA